MCYHTTYLFLSCGHAGLGNPIPDSQCSQQDARSIRHSKPGVCARQPDSQEVQTSLPSPPTTPPPPRTCREKLTHPMHTFRIKSLCSSCQEERDARVEAFEAYMRDNLEQRILTRSAERNDQGWDSGRRRLFRASNTVELFMDAPRTPGTLNETTMEDPFDTHSGASTPRTPVGEGVGNIMQEFRRRVSRNVSSTASTPVKSRPDSGEQPVPSSPAAPRWTFAALIGAPAQG